jgi:hypothetical protein
MKQSTEYWAKMSQDPHQEIQKQWIRCKKHWDKINKVMKDIGLPEFDTLDNFVDLSNIVESHAKQDSLWTEELAKIVEDARASAMICRTSNQSSNHATTVELQSSKVPVHAMDIRGIHVAPMEQHRFPWAQTCEELFISWSEYERKSPFSRDISG